MCTLITAPYSPIGGVTTFVNSIVPEFKGRTIIFRRGKRIEKNIVINYLSLVLSPLRFFCYLLYYNPSKVIINTSLSNSLLYRDGIFVIVAKILKKDILLVIHGFKEKSLVHKKLLKLGYFRANAICVLSESYKNAIVEAGYKGNTYTQFNPVSKDILYIKDEKYPSLSRLLFMGRIETAKGIYISLDVFRTLKKRHPEILFDIVGIGSEYENVLQYIKDNDIEGITMYGFKSGDEKKRILMNNAITLLPSYNEGLPISILEAMAVGQLVITRPIGGIVDLYQHCNFGKLISSSRAKDFAEAYEELIANPEKVILTRMRNREFAREHFSPQAIANNIERIFDEMQK